MRTFLILPIVGLLLSAFNPAMAAADIKTSAEPIPSAVFIGSSDWAGPIYTTSAGMTLYTTAMDERKPGVFGCSGTRSEKGRRGGGFPLPRYEHRRTCIQRWLPFAPIAGVEPIGRWTILTRPNDQKQWAFDGKPVYTSTRDKAPGDVNGTMGFARHGVWRLVEVPRRFPRGVKVIFKVDGLMLADEKTDRLLFSTGTKTNSGNAEWTAVFASELDMPFDDWDLAVHTGGGRQWTFKGMPLYRPRDGAQVSKNVAAGRWQPIVFHKAKDRPAFLTMQMTVPEVGWVYSNAQGRTLYAFSCFDGPDQLPCDEPGDAAAHRSALCGTGEQCAREWRPVLAAPDDAPVGYWGIDKVPDPPFADAAGAYGENVPTVRAWTYHGRPVYTFSGDKYPGEALAHGMMGTSSAFGVITLVRDRFPFRP